ncbi:flavin reductase family protein [Natrarchaeobius oligotrophus]|uniref:Flavin reductase family protein n=1 Tax=Natrarchaeobius chitinivorans TaxID=1679083 RepID=A0A3N6PPZ7_NATCH|nr:flavin reductase family protein [Natrarchaeobius chitinivorans]RQH01306.1 flavin reductase family protein [Natrarchaeobius chitinivorans]
MEIVPEEVEPQDMYRILNSLVIPRPIAWVSSIGSDGTKNLAPFSFFNISSDSEPPVVMFSPGSKDNGPKDTTKNILETEEFVVNIVTEEFVSQMDQTSTTLPYRESEWDFADISSESSTDVTPPRVSGIKIALECRLHETVAVGEHTTIFGEVIRVHLKDSVITDGKIDTTKVNAIGRIGGSYYTSIDKLEFDSDTLDTGFNS